MQGSVRTRRTGNRGLPAAAPGSGAPSGSASAVLGGGTVLRAADVDVGQARERRRQRRLPGWPSSSGWPPWASGGGS